MGICFSKIYGDGDYREWGICYATFRDMMLSTNAQSLQLTFNHHVVRIIGERLDLISGKICQQLIAEIIEGGVYGKLRIDTITVTRFDPFAGQIMDNWQPVILKQPMDAKCEVA